MVHVFLSIFGATLEGLLYGLRVSTNGEGKHKMCVDPGDHVRPHPPGLTSAKTVLLCNSTVMITGASRGEQMADACGAGGC